MTVYNIPYNPRSDPKALFAQGIKNMVGGLLQGQRTSRLGEFAEGMDPNATAMQIVSSALSKGISPQTAMGLGGLQQRGQVGPSQMMALERWNKYNQAKAMGDTETANRLLSSALVNFDFGSIPGFLKGDTPGDTEENIKNWRDKQLEPDVTPLTEPQVAGYGEAMDVRFDKAKRAWFKQKGRVNYPESELFREWQIFAGIHKFKNETQKEQIWNTWKNKVRNRGAAGWLGGKETDWDPTDPKWREAIGLKAPVENYQQPKTSEDFEKTISLIKNQKQQELYFNKWKHLWPDDYE